MFTRNGYKNYFKAREILRRIYGKRFMAFPIDQCEMVDYFEYINKKHGMRLN